MSHEQESTVAVPGVTIQDFASDWGRQESPGYHFNGVDKARLLLGEIRHAVRDGDLKIFDPFLGRERLFRDSDSPTLDRGRIKVLPSSINAWLRSIGMATMPATEQPMCPEVPTETHQATEGVSTEGLVAWQAVMIESWPEIVKAHQGRTTTLSAVKWIKKYGPRDVIPAEQPDARSLRWIDRDGGVQTVLCKSVGTRISEWRKAGLIPA